MCVVCIRIKPDHGEDYMEDRAFRKGLSIAAIVLIAISALLLSLSNTNGILYGPEVSLYGMPFIAAFAIPLLAVLIILSRYCNSTDTLEEMIASIAVRYSIFGWFFVFLIKFAAVMLKPTPAAYGDKIKTLKPFDWQKWSI